MKRKVDKYGNKRWYKKGLLFREGEFPAIEMADGSRYWLQNGKCHRDNDLPAVEEANGTKEWYQNGWLHRDNDLPAVEFTDGAKEWCQNGKLHRLIGPAVTGPNSTKEYWIEGKEYTEKEFKDKTK